MCMQIPRLYPLQMNSKSLYMKQVDISISKSQYIAVNIRLYHVVIIYSIVIPHGLLFLRVVIFEG